MNDLIGKARLFATAAHGATGQKRKYTHEPYINHPRAVALMVSVAGGTPEMIAAAWLHDVVEDTAIPIELIYHEFGAPVGALVAGLTDVSNPVHGNRAARKHVDLLHTAAQSNDCKTIKLADLLHNTESIMRHDRNFAAVYLAEKRALLAVLAGANPKLHRQATLAVEEGLADLARGV